jgi:hypothetical protein
MAGRFVEVDATVEVGGDLDAVAVQAVDRGASDVPSEFERVPVGLQ